MACQPGKGAQNDRSNVALAARPEAIICTAINVLSWQPIPANAISFSAKWQVATREEAEAQPFTLFYQSIWSGRASIYADKLDNPNG